MVPRMPYQNRVDPFGTLIASSARGTWMGNRGILHNDYKQITCTHAHQNWVTCSLTFNGRKRTIMAAGRYTELFFLDEATSFAAGHRPCAECRRQRYNEFTAVWRKTQEDPELGRSLAQTIDRVLHAHRIARGGRKVTFQSTASDLPDGTMVTADKSAVLLWQNRQYDWSSDGYEPRRDPLTGTVTVLTPKPVVDMFAAGFVPTVHPTAA